jgi:alkanesulfonate monooxygenase SsuD/methylene tetrahydromethanopterin reductase-like flavin-dependent oxidoreductase (luciferase family)
VHFGVILPNYGLDSNPDGIRRVAEAAEELGFDSVWATEHIIGGPEAVDPYGRVYAPVITLAWIAGWTQRIHLGTSIVLAPLHHPIHLAKEVATLQELSGRRFLLGVGMGCHEDEYDFMGVEFKGRGRRGDEAIRSMGSLWTGEHPGTFEPRPSTPPEIWIGGSSEPAIRRALELGDACGIRRAARTPTTYESRAGEGSSANVTTAPAAPASSMESTNSGRVRGITRKSARRRSSRAVCA